MLNLPTKIKKAAVLRTAGNLMLLTMVFGCSGNPNNWHFFPGIKRMMMVIVISCPFVIAHINITNNYYA